MKKFPVNAKQLVVAALLVVSFFLLMDLNSRLNDLFRLTAQRDTMQTEVSSLNNTLSAVDTKVAFATSEAAVPPWARKEAGMGQPGDIPVIPLAPKGSTPLVQAQPTPTPRVVQHWEKWWALFFGK